MNESEEDVIVFFACNSEPRVCVKQYAKACSSLLGLIISAKGPSGSLDSVRRKRSQYEPLALAMVSEDESWSGWAVVEQGSEPA